MSEKFTFLWFCYSSDLICVQSISSILFLCKEMMKKSSLFSSLADETFCLNLFQYEYIPSHNYNDPANYSFLNGCQVFFLNKHGQSIVIWRLVSLLDFL
jgi:hypothetical protein